jgi:CheY-like chemotaxis protein
MFRPSDYDVAFSEEEFRLLRDFVHERYGLYFADGQKSSLSARLAGRLSALDLGSFEDYYHYLRFGPQRHEELRSMVSHLTNNETYFYREQPQLQVFAGHILGGLKESKAKSGDRSLNVLSAGCSTGEEAHTVAMVVYDSGQFFWNWNVQIIGMDVDEVALEKARKATYSTTRSGPAPRRTASGTSTPWARRPGQGRHPQARAAPLREHPGVRQLRGTASARRRLLPQRPHLFLGRGDPARGPALPQGPGARRLPAAGPRRVPVAHQRHLHADPLPGRDDLPQAWRCSVNERSGPIRVLVVDDSAFVRQALSRMLGSDPDLQVVGLAADGREGIDKVVALKPDVVTLDIQMPRMGGLEALKHIMAESPVPVLLLSSLTREGAAITLQGLELGALDFVDKSRVQGT